jgi:hypothetical protein
MKPILPLKNHYRDFFCEKYFFWTTSNPGKNGN